MNKQETFNAVVKFARKQGAKSMNDKGCRYRSVGYNGKQLCCFVGAFIPDNLYFDSSEGDSVSYLSESIKKKLRIDGLTKVENGVFWLHMQSIHDDFDPSKWGAQFSKYAYMNDLVYDNDYGGMAQ